MTRWRLDISYDGSDFHGWAAQRGLRTVQGELELWLNRLVHPATEISLTVAGRTDAGVHARGQVAHLDLADAVDGLALAHRLRRVLPADLVLTDMRPAPAGFDARFSAIWRRYCYRLWDASWQPDPLLRHQIIRVNDPLDLTVMNEAGSRLLGLRDFAAFCKKSENGTTIRQLTACSVRQGPVSLECWVQADAFCHSMVRSLVGALVLVGSKRRDLAWLDEVAAMSERCGQVHKMPAAGLCLEEVGYPADAELAERARTARARRDLADCDCSLPQGDSPKVGQTR